MIPITRKELYLNKIVGNDDYSVPEKPISEEEFFFAEILGEAVQAPEPLTRYQIYLAKIAGKDVEIPYPETRLEYFLAKAAGMEIETPAPITREEIFWSNYSAIVDFEVEGVPPLTYKAIEGTLENYRIYGNTVNGENVGDLITEGEHAGEYKVPVTVEGKNLLQNTATSTTKNGVTFTVNSDGSVTCNGTANDNTWFDINRSFDIYSPDGRIASIGNQGSLDTFYMNIGHVGRVINSLKYSNTTHNNAFIHIVIASGYTCDNLTFYPMIRKADITDDTYEPYHAPVTTPIYLPEPLKMVGGEAEYIDYGEQKQHRVRKNLLPNTATSRTINGVTFMVNNDGSVTCNGTASVTTWFALNTSFDIYAPDGRIVSIGNNGSTSTFYLNISYIGNITSSSNYSKNIHQNAYVQIVIIAGYNCDNLTFYPMIRKADIEDDTYEPYIADTELDVTLPALPTLTGTNVLSVGTAVQPSKVYVKYKEERQ